MTQNVLIEFSSNTQGIETAVDAVETLGTAEKALAKDFASTNTAIKERDKAISDTNSKLDEFASKLKNVDKAATGSAGKKMFDELGKAGVDALRKISSQMQASGTASSKFASILSSGVDDALREAGVSADDFKNALKNAGITIEEFADFLANTAVNTDEFGDAMGGAEEKTTKLKTRIREIKEELARMDMAGQSGTQAFKDLAAEAAELEDQVGDTSARVKALASDTANIDAALSGLSTLASGFQLVTAAQALAGDENEQLQKTLVKLNAVMAFTSAIQSIVNNLQKDSILVIKAQAVANSINATATRAAAAAFTQLGVTVTATSVAFRVLKAALISTGILAIVVLIGEAIAVLSEWSEESETAAEAQDKVREATEKFTEAVNDQIDALDYDNKLLRLRAELAGKTEKEISAISRKEIEDRINLRNKEMSVAINNGLGITELAKANAKDIQALTVFDLETQIDANKKKVEDAKETADKLKEIAEKNQKASFEIQQRGIQREIELLNDSVTNDAGPFALRLEALREYNDKNLQLIELRRRNELKQEGLTALEVKNINDKYNAEKLDQLAEFNKSRESLIKAQQQKEIDELAAFQQELVEAEARAQAGRIDNVDKLFAQYKQLNLREQDQRLASLKSEYESGNITVVQYEEKRQQIKAEYQRREINNELAHLEALSAIRLAAGEDVTEVEAAILDAKERLREIDLQKSKEVEQKKMDAIKERKEAEEKFYAFVADQLSKSSTVTGQVMGGIITAAQQLRSILNDDTLSVAEKRVAAVVAVTQVAAQAIDQVFSIQAQRRKEELDLALSDLDRQMEKELSAKNLTESQKLNIEERYRARERQIKTNAAMKEREAQKTQAIAQGLLAGINALASIPFPFNIAAAAVIAGMVAMQVSELSRLPVPQYRTGEVDINGPGTTTSDSILARISKGESVINAQATAAYKPALMAINNMEFDKYLEGIIASRMRSFMPPIMTDMPEWASSKTPDIDYKKMAAEIAQQVGRVSDIPGVDVRIDKNGLFITVKKGLDTIEFQNSRYSMR